MRFRSGSGWHKLSRGWAEIVTAPKDLIIELFTCFERVLYCCWKRGAL